MAEDTNFTSLNFNHDIIGKSLNDKKTGLEIQFGYVSGLPGDYAELMLEMKGFAIGLMDRGMGQELLDQACRKLIGDCMNEDFEILITKSDLFYDSRWYIIGNLQALVLAAQQDQITLPFSDFLYDDVLEELSQYL